jgi:hypothetical protein
MCSAKLRLFIFNHLSNHENSPIRRSQADGIYLYIENKALNTVLPQILTEFATSPRYPEGRRRK